MAYKPIRDYAIIGNLRSAVLIGKDGSIDWAPAPFIDSPSIFSAILDDEKGGCWYIRLAESYQSAQHYRDETNVLVTTFTGESGELEITDFIPIEEEKRFMPAEEETTFKLKRRVRCTRGTCHVKVHFEPRFDYARGATELSYIEGGLHVQNGDMRGVLVAHQKLTISDDADCAEATFELAEGEEDFYVFRYNIGTVNLEKDDNEHHAEELEKTAQEWQAWAHKCDLDVCPVGGRWESLITRSALMLKILFFEPVGTVAAAPTTSLPERIGGVRNWDYRFTWLRDSTYLFRAFFRLGHVEEAEEYLNWLVEICSASTPENIQIMYGLRGETQLDEEILANLKGYQNSKPVRIGNGAYLQKQWDIYGSMLDMAWHLHLLRENEQPIMPDHWDVLRGIADHVVRIWREPDEGLWEVRGGADHFVYSKAMCWIALDRAVKIAGAYDYPCDRDLWERERDAIAEEIHTRGYNKELGSYTQSFDSDQLDAAVLLLPAIGFVEGTDPRMLSTIRCLKDHLTCGDGLLLRYTSDDGLPGGEGAFLLASFWLVDALALAGELDEALALFEKMAGHGNHVGLFSEEMDPQTYEFLGNFPQAYTHIGLINSALLLRSLLDGERLERPSQRSYQHDV